MNKYIKNLERIEFVVTYACTGRCKHCSEGEHTAGGIYIDSEAAQSVIYNLCEKYNIKSVMTFGGEPLLHINEVCSIHSAAEKMNIPDRDLITNGYFSKNTDKINDTAYRLAQSGVSSILLSADAFHQETIPLAYVMQFAAAVKENGIPLQVHPAWLVDKDNDNPYNIKTKEILNAFSDIGIEESSGNVIFPSGNALKYLGEYFDSDREYSSPYKENPQDIHAICISPNGDVLSGNIYKTDILDIIKNYQPKL